jgi:D-glycero-alpha-D-manno-heptose-7-phosphate kinase
MIITRSPFRISYVGGGSDLPAFYREFGGSVISSTINKYIYVSTHKYFDPQKLLAKYSRTEMVSSVSELDHPILKAVLQRFNFGTGIEITSIADIPSGTGMGSSSTFAVASIHNFRIRVEGGGTHTSKYWLAEKACQVELEDLSEPIGKQDQYAAAFGGFNKFNFNHDDTVTVLPLNISNSNDWLKHLKLYYLGNQRSASAILSRQNKEIAKSNKKSILREMVSLVDPFANSLTKGDWMECGRLMHNNWNLKKKMTHGISDSLIDGVYDTALKCGAIGGKLLGAGGGGFMLFVIDPAQQNKLDSKLSGFTPYSFNWDFEGSTVVYSNENK